MTLAGLASTTQEWREVTPQVALYLFTAAGFILVGYIAAITAMRYGEISFVSPFRYTVIVWAMILGFFVFGDIPDSITVMGSLIVVGAGVFTIYRERKIVR